MEPSEASEGALSDGTQLVRTQVKELQIRYLVKHMSLQVSHSVPLDVPVMIRKD